LAGQLGVQQWLDDIFDPTKGIQAQLIAMQNALTPPAGTGVITECVEFVVDQYQQGSGPTKAVFDWTGIPTAPGVYDVVQQLTSYYFLYQTWAAVLLSEAYHVQACLDLESDTLGADRNCTFGGNPPATPQAGVTSNTAYNICENPANNQVAGDCLSAQSAFTNLNDNGAYDGLRAQLIEAGAPYSNALLGKVMTPGGLSKVDLVYPKSLEDFTNGATLNGKKIQTTPCAVPLTSAAPCGFTVGVWNGPAPSGTTYGAVTDASGKVLFGGYSQWQYGDVSFEGDNLATLLANYNAETAGNTSGSLGDWMKSVGFIDNTDPTKGPIGSPYNKIILTGEDHNAGEQEVAGAKEAVCMLDTNFHLSNSIQPFCSDGGTASHFNLLQPSTEVVYTAAIFTTMSAAPDFYIAEVQLSAVPYEYIWKTFPGWTIHVQGNSQFHHFHWPSMAIQDLSSSWCTIRNQGTAPKDARNPGGVLTMCGPDLEGWLDLVLPKPPVSATVASADTTLYRGEPNRNDGALPELRLTGRSDLAKDEARRHHRARGANRLVVAFDPDAIQRFLEEGPIGTARLVLTPTGEPDGLGGRGWQRHLPRLAAWPSSDPFEEGNGNSAAGDPGAGVGATWNCGEDAEIGDDLRDCLVGWTLRRFGGPGSQRPVLSYQEGSSPAVFEVADDITGGISTWVIELFDRRPRRNRLAYVAREGAAALGDLELAPTLILTHDLSRAQPMAENVAK
jgi:hypothetical protein